MDPIMLLAVQPPPAGTPFLLYVLIILMIVSHVVGLLVLYFNKEKNKFIMEKEVIRARLHQERLKAELETTEETSRRIAADLHNSIGQELALLSSNLHILRDRPERFTDAFISEVSRHAKKVMQEVRLISHSLYGYHVVEQGLAAAIVQCMEGYPSNEQTTYSLSIPDGYHPTLPDDTAIILYRMFQEGLSNAQKYAEASEIRVSLYPSGGMLHLQVEDNGKGFDPARRGFGLKTIADRVALMGGTLHLESVPQRGTKLCIQLNEHA